MNVVIVGVTGFRNRGVEALVRPMVDHLLRRHPSVRVTIVSWSPDFDAGRINDPRVTFVKDEFLDVFRWGSGAASSRTGLWQRAERFMRGAVASAFRTRLAGSDDVMPFAAPDALLVTGGDIFGSDYGVDSLRHYVEPVLWSRRRGVPCAVIGHSVGRFRTPLDIRLWRQVEAAATVITLRESLSRDYLVHELASPPERLEVTADMAFLLEPRPVTRGEFSRRPCRPTVAAAISAGICQWGGQSTHLHVDAWVAALRMVLDDWNADVLIVPHVQEAFSDDRSIAAVVMKRLHDDPRVRLVEDDLDAAEMKWLISGCDMLLAERMHAAIAGLSSGVATVPIGYSIKAQGILGEALADSGIAPAELGMSVGEFVDVEKSLPRLRRIWHERLRYAAALAGTVERSKRAARRNLEIIDSLLTASESP